MLHFEFRFNASNILFTQLCICYKRELETKNIAAIGHQKKHTSIYSNIFKIIKLIFFFLKLFYQEQIGLWHQIINKIFILIVIYFYLFWFISVNYISSDCIFRS